MILDASNQLSASQAVTASAVSSNTIDLSQAHDVGAGRELTIIVSVELAALAAGAATVNFQVITSAAANLSSPTIIGQTDAIPKASLTTGVVLEVRVPRSIINQVGQRYLGLQYTVATGPLTQGTFSARVDFGGSFPAKPPIYSTAFAIT